MMKNQELYILIADKKWYEIVAHYSPSAIVHALSFCECIKLANDLLDQKLWDFDLHVYAAKLLEIVRHHYSRDWNSSWKYDVFLGQVCNIALDYDGRYEAFLRAYEKSKAQSAPQLLIGLANCYDCPGKPPISYSQVVAYLQIALKDHLYRDGIGVMRGAWYLIEDKKKSAYWGYLYHLLWHIGIDSPQIVVECLEQYVTFQKNAGAERQHKKLQELFSRKTISELIEET